MTSERNIPSTGYGIVYQNSVVSEVDEAVERIQNLGFAIIDSGYSKSEIDNISVGFNRARRLYIELYGETYLREINEFYTIRSPLTNGDDLFLHLALNNHLLSVLAGLFTGKFILNQQNGIVNPSREKYNQSEWHRDLPYQHFVSSRPLAINALFCVDDFSVSNGATFVLPASHKSEKFPSWDYVQKNAMQIEAKAGSYILLDCMIFHAGGFNATDLERRAVNHVYNIPYFKQQINIPGNMKNVALTEQQRDILGFNYTEPATVRDYLSSRHKT